MLKSINAFKNETSFCVVKFLIFKCQSRVCKKSISIFKKIKSKKFAYQATLAALAEMNDKVYHSSSDFACSLNCLYKKLNEHLD
jgi:hypothetical protein